MARLFNGSTDVVTCDPGACTFTGNLTIAAICTRTTSTSSQALMDAVTSGATGYWEFLVLPSNVGAANCIQLVTQAGHTETSSMTLVTADSWCLLAVTKATGASTPTFYKYKYSTDAFTSENGLATVADNTGTNIVVHIGNSSPEAWNGEIAALGCWNAVLTSSQIQNLAFGLNAWFAVQPKGLWLLDQSATGQNVVDLSGGGANQSSLTGTSVSTSSVPVFNYETGVWQPTIVSGGSTNATVTVPAAAAAPASAPTPVPTLALASPAAGAQAA